MNYILYYKLADNFDTFKAILSNTRLLNCKYSTNILKLIKTCIDNNYTNYTLLKAVMLIITISFCTNSHFLTNILSIKPPSRCCTIYFIPLLK